MQRNLESRQTIKDIVFNYVHRNKGVVDYHRLSKEVLKGFPDSKWQHTHWGWYRYQFLKGRFQDQISEEERLNLESYRKLRKTNNYSRTEVALRRRPGKSTRIARSKTRMQKVFPNKLKEEQRLVALSLARVCHHAHPKIVERISKANKQEEQEIAEILPREVDITDYLHNGSACVFPGVRRFIGRLNKRELLKYIPEKRAIIDDNRFPRHFWTFLVTGQAYSGPTWKRTGLGEFELAHIFSHKTEERKFEERAFERVDLTQKPYGLFTCPSNVVLVPKGMAKPTDNLDAVLIAFFKRYSDLYGEGRLPGLRGLKESTVPEWYGDLKWNEPILPRGWEDSVSELLKYRHARLRQVFASAASK